jgi:hypothetical protein
LLRLEQAKVDASGAVDANEKGAGNQASPFSGPAAPQAY